MAAESFDDLFDRAQRAMKEGFAEQALLPATEAVKISPDRWDARLLLARVWLAQRRPDRALSDVHTALTLGAGKIDDEGTRDAHQVIALASLAQGDTVAAEESLRILCKRADSVTAAVRLIAMLMAANRRADAKEVALECCSVHAAHAERLRALADALGMEDPSAAERELAELEIDVDLLDEARARLQKLFAKNPRDEGLQESLRVIAAGGRTKPREKREAAALARMTPVDRTRRLSAITRALSAVLALGGIALCISPASAAAFLRVTPAQIVAVSGVLLVGAVALLLFDRRSLRSPSP